MGYTLGSKKLYFYYLIVQVSTCKRTRCFVSHPIRGQVHSLMPQSRPKQNFLFFRCHNEPIFFSPYRNLQVFITSFKRSLGKISIYLPLSAALVSELCPRSRVGLSSLIWSMFTAVLRLTYLRATASLGCNSASEARLFLL